MLYCTNENDMLKRSLLFSFLITNIWAFAQDTVRFSIANDYGLVDYAKTTITNTEHLKPLFEKLHQLKKEKRGTINILHLGDSHIQGGYMTQQVRQNFQLEFGNAGRGFVVPLRVAGTNEPYSYRTESTAKWESKRMVFPDQPLPIGLGGVSIRTEDENTRLTLSVNNYTDLNYGFNRVTTFFFKEPRSFNLMIQDSLNQTLAFVGNFSPSGVMHSATVNLPVFYNKLNFNILKSLQTQNRFTIFGFNLENGQPGILYHSIGVNGAKYKHYLTTDYLIDQTPALKPDLIILALGTNEALDHPYSDPKLGEQVKTLIEQLKRYNPNAVFLISVHPDTFKKKTKRNPGVQTIREKLIEAAVSNKVAYFDLYSAGGGKHSADTWTEAKLLREDGVHFTRAGYELQGNMFYLAFIKAYNQYVSDRR
jgi:lysophospholipase L1-like esterase